MGAHTFGFPHDRPLQSSPPSVPVSVASPPGRTVPKGRMPWSRRDAAGRSLSIKIKLAIAAMTIILLHLVGANVLFPMLTHHTIGSAQDIYEEGSLSTPVPMASTSDSGGIIRLLSETASSWTGAGMSKEQAAVLAKYGDENFRGEDIWMKRDWMTNPLALPPNDTEAAADPDNVLRYTARTFNALYRDKCGNSSLLPYDGGTGREWVTTSRTWARLYGDQVSKYRWCRGGSVNEVPELKQVLMLRSEKARPKRAVTVVTQLSLERAAMLEQQCTLWPHPIAAVVYIPLLRGRIFSPEEGPWGLAPLEHAVQELRAMHDRLSQLPEGCVLDMEVVVEECCNKDIGSMYPTNAVRNRALQLASTEVVLLLDVDFVVDLSLARTLEDRRRYAELVELLSRQHALVLPAFEAWDQGEWGKKVALEAVHQGKAYITAKFMYNVVIGFHMSHYPQGHEKTNFWKWINSTDAYEVEYQIGFEPYIMLLKKFVPYYDERFRGYYWNKVQHLMHVSMQNSFTFVVHPEAFVVHVPHKKPSTKVRTRRSGQKERNHVMFLEALEDMKNDRFVPVTGFPHLCLPPDLQRSAARVVSNEEQRASLLKMAGVVRKVPSEELQGGGEDALAKARGTPANISAATVSAAVSEVHYNIDGDEDDGSIGGIAGGELPATHERPVIASAVEQQEKAKRLAAERAAEELEEDLKELAEAEAEAAKKSGMTDYDLVREEEEDEEAALEEARETAAMVQEIIAKEAKRGERVEVEDYDAMEEDENAAAGADVVRGAGQATSLYPDERDRRSGGGGKRRRRRNNNSNSSGASKQTRSRPAQMDYVDDTLDDQEVEVLVEEYDDYSSSGVRTVIRRGGGGGGGGEKGGRTRSRHSIVSDYEGES